MNLLEASIESIQQAMNSGSLTAVQLTQYYLDRIAAYDQQGPGLNSIRVLNDDVLKQAEALDDERNQQRARSMLHGIPILVKDNYETKGMPTTVGSVIFKGFAPDRDAHLVSKLKNAGALLLGKTNMGICLWHHERWLHSRLYPQSLRSNKKRWLQRGY